MEFCYNSPMKIGIFDSGNGGEIIAAGLERLLPEYEYVVINDRQHVPYGSRSDAEVLALTDAAIQPLLKECPVVVIACNTATMAAIAALRQKYPATTFVGIEPMVKPAAAASRNQHIAVLATPLTLQSARYQQLRANYGSGVIVDEPNTAGWAAAIERDTLSEISFDELRQVVATGCDVIVLACTHYLALIPKLLLEFPSVTILEPTTAIARQITKLRPLR